MDLQPGKSLIGKCPFRWRCLKIKNQSKFLLLLKALIAVSALFVFPSWRYPLFFILFLWLLFDLFKKRGKLVLFDLLAAIFVLAAMYPLRAPLDKMRFFLWQGRYASAVETMLPELSRRKDSSWEEYRPPGLWGLSEGRAVYYGKYNGSILIYFPSSTTFFNTYGFVFFSDQTARDFLEHPGGYDPSLSEEKAYDEIEALKRGWAYVKLY